MKKAVLVFLLLSLILLPLCAVSQFDVRHAYISIDVGKDAVHSVREDYDFYYNISSHGFYRDIPTDYSEWKVRARVTDINCSDPFSVEEEGGYVSLKIGSSSSYITGEKSYSISYNYDLGADYNEGYDEFYMNLIGSSWDSPFDSVDFRVTVPYTGDDMDIHVTGGSYGSTSFSGYYSTEVVGDKTVITGHAENLSRGQALTVRIDLPEGFYEGARLILDNRGRAVMIVSILSAVLALFAALVWFITGKDENLIITARFNAPDGFTPLAAGYVSDGTVDDKDITSMIYYWADKGCLRIEEPKKDKFEFIKLSELPESSPSYEKKLFSAFFNRADSSGRIKLKDLQAGNFSQAMIDANVDVCSYFSKERKIQDTKSQVRQAVFSFLSLLPGIMGVFALTRYEFASEEVFLLLAGSVISPLVLLLLFFLLFRKWYLRKTNLFFELFILIVFAALFAVRNAAVSYFYEEAPLYFPLATLGGTALTALFACIMPRRSEYGQKMMEEVLGYREFIDKVEVEKLKMMIDTDPLLYYHVLSYAVVFGLENKWAKKFASLKVSDPQWYTGVSPFDVMLYSSMSSRMNSAVRLNSIPASVGRSGSISFGGGGFHSSGFSGGGFGGGGGHAW